MSLYPPESNSAWQPRRIDEPWPTVRRERPCQCSVYARLHRMAATRGGMPVWICVSCERITTRKPEDSYEPKL